MSSYSSTIVAIYLMILVMIALAVGAIFTNIMVTKTNLNHAQELVNNIEQEDGPNSLETSAATVSNPDKIDPYIQDTNKKSDDSKFPIIISSIVVLTMLMVAFWFIYNHYSNNRIQAILGMRSAGSSSTSSLLNQSMMQNRPVGVADALEELITNTSPSWTTKDSNDISIIEPEGDNVKYRVIRAEDPNAKSDDELPTTTRTKRVIR